jgi:hypothetical protein
MISNAAARALREVYARSLAMSCGGSEASSSDIWGACMYALHELDELDE